MKEIGGYVFASSPELTRVVLPDSLTDIGSYTFFGCTQLQTVQMTGGEPVPSAYNSFLDCPNLCEICVPKGSVDAYQAAWPAYANIIRQEGGAIVTFDANGGSVSTRTVTTNADGRLSGMPEPTRAGYLFKGWYTAASGGTKVTTNTVFKQNTTVYAHWTERTAMVTFDANGGSVSAASALVGEDGMLERLPQSPEPQPSGELYIIPDLTAERDGYRLDGWYTERDGGTKVTTTTIFTEDTTIYAHWTIDDRIKVTFISFEESKTIRVGKDGRIPGILFPNLSRDKSLEGFANPLYFGSGLPWLEHPIFKGWFTEPDGKGVKVNETTVFKSDTTVYAHWVESESEPVSVSPLIG